MLERCAGKEMYLSVYTSGAYGYLKSLLSLQLLFFL